MVCATMFDCNRVFVVRDGNSIIIVLFCVECVKCM